MRHHSPRVRKDMGKGAICCPIPSVGQSLNFGFVQMIYVVIIGVTIFSVLGGSLILANKCDLAKRIDALVQRSDSSLVALYCASNKDIENKLEVSANSDSRKENVIAVIDNQSEYYGNQPQSAIVVDSKQDVNPNLSALAGLTYVSDSFVKMTGAGTFALDTNSYLSSLSGAVLTNQVIPQTLGSNEQRLYKLFVSDITVSNAIVGNIAGNAGTVTNGLYTTDIGTLVQGYSASTALRTDKLSVFAPTSSLELSSVISDETGSGLLVLGTSPSFTTNISAPSIISTGAIDITPNAGSSLNIALSTTGDLAVNTNQLYVDTSAGNVGIGTTGPAYKLDVAGSANLSSGNAYYINGTSVLNATTLGSGVVSSSLTSIGTLSSGAVPASLVTAGTFGTGAYVMDTSLRVPLVIGSTSTTGDLSLQTTSGVGETGADMHFLVGNNGATEAMTILNAGNVGIGTTGPTLKLQVAGNNTPDTDPVALAVSDPTNMNERLTLGYDITNHWATIQSINSGVLVKPLLLNPRGGTVGINYTNPGTSAALAINGNVGIGTTSPLAKLHVEGQCVTGDTLLPIRRRRRRKNSEDEDEDLDPTSADGYGEAQWEYFLCRMDEILPGDEVLSLNEDTGALEYARINKRMDMGVQDVYELTTRSGRKIRTTSNHPYLIKVKS